MEIISTKYGVLTNVSNYETYDNGHIKSVNVSGSQKIKTDYGELKPRDLTVTDEEMRGKTTGYSITFYKNGHLKKIMLEEQTEIMTPIGKMKAELITFYEDGNIHRVFPLNGRIDGFWTEEKEKERAEYSTIKILEEELKVMLMGIRFYRSGKIKSILIWPGENSTVLSPVGIIPFRQGLSFYENGKLESVEPALPMYIETPIGLIEAYDNQALGLHADYNSLKFNSDGELVSLMTNRNSIEVTQESGETMFFQPKEIPSRMDIRQTEILPLCVGFNGKEIFFNERKEAAFNIEKHSFRINKTRNMTPSCSGDCSSCSGCGI